MKMEDVLVLSSDKDRSDVKVESLPLTMTSSGYSLPACVQPSKCSMPRERYSGISNSDKKSVSAKMIQPSSATSLELLTKMAVQYSTYCQTDLSAQISRIEEYLQESIAKLEEQQSLFEIKEIESREWTQVILPQLVNQAQLLSTTMTKRLDSLNELIVSIKVVLDQLEKQITLAEQKLGLHPSPSSFRSVFKYFMKSENVASISPESPEVAGWEVVKSQLICDDPLNLSTFFKTNKIPPS